MLEFLTPIAGWLFALLFLAILIWMFIDRRRLIDKNHHERLFHENEILNVRKSFELDLEKKTTTITELMRKETEKIFEMNELASRNDSLKRKYHILLECFPDLALFWKKEKH